MEIGTKIGIASAVESQVNKYTCNSDSAGNKSIVTHSPFSIFCSLKSMKPTAISHIRGVVAWGRDLPLCEGCKCLIIMLFLYT